jgi:hypothetical protein
MVNIHYTKTYKFNMSGGGLPSRAYTITFQANRGTLYIDQSGTIHHVAQIQGSASGVWPLFGNDNVRVTNQERNNELGLWVNGIVDDVGLCPTGIAPCQWTRHTVGPSTDATIDLGSGHRRLQYQRRSSTRDSPSPDWEGVLGKTDHLVAARVQRNARNWTGTGEDVRFAPLLGNQLLELAVLFF